ncbi:MAG: hypothetical protein HY270_01715 [Deltaproteobacteria bacterium]|nr:hypothetical protein [Deltaproteobacteria bacterium]
MRTIRTAALALCVVWGAAAASAQTCGNGTVEAPEECDNGGICIGSSNAGTACTANSQCPEGLCKPFGGDGCAANCTTERDLLYDLVPGVGSGFDLQPGTSGLVINAFITLPIPLSGHLTLTVGKERDGQVPTVVKGNSIVFPAIPVLGQACGCVHGGTFKTCGGTYLEPDGSQSKDCTTKPDACNGLKPCTDVHGPGNTGSGVVGCSGIDGVNLDYSIDAGGESGNVGSPVVTTSGSGGAGSSVVLTTIGVNVVLGGCTGTSSDYGPDGQFCTADDQSTLGASATNPAVTGTASATISNLPDGSTIGPVTVSGSAFSCAKLAAGNPGGGGIVSAFAIPDIPQIGPVAVTVALVAKETTTASTCAGDCGGDGEVTVDELITMVNVALGNAQASTCTAGDTNGDNDITIDEIVAAVGKALNGCA